jgi:mannose-6-phosphate isomerase-like protein (cupin superfamily)
MIESIELEEKMTQIQGKHCQPTDIVKLNDQVIRLSYIDGEFHWHKHSNQDELFYVLKGKLKIKLKNQSDLILSEGQLAKIPKGVEHYPISIEPCFVILFEPVSLITKGD